jgi:hypothetical protein
MAPRLAVSPPLSLPSLLQPPSPWRARRYVEDMVFPTLRFPSDHGIVATSLQTSAPPHGPAHRHRRSKS